MLHLHRHVQYTHQEETSACSSCSRRFAAKSSLVRHLHICKKKKRTDLPLPTPVQLEPEDPAQDENEVRAVGNSSHVPSDSSHTVPVPGDEKEK